jgi:hypothetical protein
MKNIFIGIAGITALLIVSLSFLIGCTDKFGTGGEHGAVTVNFGGSGRFVSATPWPPTDFPGMLEQLEYVVTFTQGSNNQIFHISGETSFRVSVNTGSWNIVINAYYQERLYATGSNTAVVMPNRENTVTIQMDKAFEDDFYIIIFDANIAGYTGTMSYQTHTVGESKALTANAFAREGFNFLGWSTSSNVEFGGSTVFDNEEVVSDLTATIGATITLYAVWDFAYQIGSTGPAGGIIFYRSETGFEMTDDNSIAYYLEASPESINSTSENLGIAWGEHYIDVVGTDTIIGSGRNNTKLMLASLEESTSETAAQLCSSLGNDWFLPSKDEMELLMLNREIIGGIEPANYWTSSQNNNSSAWIFRVTNNDDFIPWDKPYAANVLAIRAF